MAKPRMIGIHNEEFGSSASANASAVSDASQENTTTKTSPKVEVPMADRAAYTPNEFAALFGKQTVWGYRKVYAGQVKVITVLGRMMIPASEVKRLQGEAAVYVGSGKKKKDKDSKALVA